MANDSARLILDLRQYREAIETSDAFQGFWQAFEKVLLGRTLPAGTPVKFEHPQKGLILVTFLDSLSAVSQGQRFSVVSILEPPRSSGYCACCRESGKESPAAYECQSCRNSDPAAGSCEHHVVILPGGVLNDGRVKSSCVKHVPVCKQCASPATFWCHGPHCRGEVAWCNSHRRAHRQDPDTGYCPACYDDLFPQCSVPNCNEPGTNRCEHVDPRTGKVCGVQLCNRHVARWQVYGPTKIGLGRCGQHRSIRNLGDEELAWQVVAGTAWRRLDGKGKQLGYSLPSLASFAHALRNSRGLAYDLAKAKQLYLSVSNHRGSGALSADLQQGMKQLINNSSGRWASDLERKGQQILQGKPYLEKLRAVLNAHGFHEASRNVAIADFVPARPQHNGETRPPILFIRLAHELRQGIANKANQPHRSFGEEIGCSLRFEKDER